ncbi:hypothetical protein Q0Z83_050840 [Actinoplanes sichuanensis]|uniref:DUF4190 domain-containing protein n=1 Tax=Actinoplanes sichuanensis TaxID=512349 RepID=A0ABW4APF2_9ACTN|nr:DUF4190 domain-containing protein [Actinoplanes sichuanensis]BEL06893.1 hypothetical protein Q0Z83_050840 [Actinoplanes sichuanensis]
MDQQSYPAVPYASPMPPPRWNGKTNGFSIASLTLALICLGGGVLSLVFGVIGLVQSIRNGDKRGRFFAIAGLAINGILIILVVVAGVRAVVRDVADGPDRDAAGAIRGERSIALRDLRAGDCVKDLEEQVGRSVDVLPCTSAHSSEVVGIFDLPGATEETAEAGCEQRFEEYTGQKRPDGAGYFVFTARMSELGFTGDDGVLCFAHQLTGTTAGSLKR